MTDAAWVALSLVERVGGKTMRALLDYFDGDPRAVLAADVTSLRRVPGIGAKMAERICAVNLVQVEHEMAKWRANGVRIITADNPDYPSRLRAVDDHPPTLFQRGDSPLEGRLVAIVGTRNPSPAALERASTLGAKLAARNYTVVSGLAIGIDAAAHRSALDEGGFTLAVVGSGVLDIYPPQNQSLASRVIGHGVVLSEFHPYATPSASNLVARNRVITGLCDAVVVVETEVDGGAMHAARFASLQERPIYTFESNASGNRELLSKGATALPPDLRYLPF